MRRARNLFPLLVAAALAGCPAAAPPAPSTATKPTTKTAVRKAPPRVPLRINLLLPPAIGLVAAGAGNATSTQRTTLVGNDGASVSQLVGNDGASLVGNDGASLVAAGGGNGIAKTAAYALTQATGDCDHAQSAKDEFLNLVQIVASAYGNPVLATNACLEAYRTQKADLDESFSFDAPWGERASAKLSARGAAGGLLQVSEGATFDANRLVIVVAFDNATKGKFMYRQPSATKLYQVLGLASTFDLVKGTASAEGFAVISPIEGQPPESSPLVRAHLEFKADRGDRKRKDVGPAFIMKASGFFHVPGEPCESDERGMVLHFDEEGRAAARMGRIFGGDTGLSFTRKIGTGYAPTADENTAFYLDATAQQPDLATVPATLTSLLPTEFDFYKPFPSDPSGKDQLADPAFAWPE